MNLLLSDIHAMTSGQLIGNPETSIQAFSGIDDIDPHSLVFIESEHYAEKVIQSAAAAVIVPLTIQTLGDKSLIQVEKPMLTFMLLLKHFFGEKKYPAKIHGTATIADSAKIHETAHIGPHVFI